MNVQSFEILAEVAVGIVGFGSIAVVLGRDRDAWESADFFRSASLFFASLGALFLALLPIGLAIAQLAPESIWRTSSAAMLLYGFTIGALVVPLRRRNLDRELWLGPILLTLVAASTVANLLAQLLNVSGMLFEPNPGCYFFGVVHFLLFSCLVLMRIVFVRPVRRDDPPRPVRS